jgi:ABC-type sugar transport system ATPase subunit
MRQRPVCRWIHRLPGDELLSGRGRKHRGRHGADRWRLGRPFGLPAGLLKPGAAVTIGVRPEHRTLSAEGDFATAGVVELVERLGEASYAHVRRADDKMTVVEIRGRRTPPPGERVPAPVTDIHVFDAEGRRVAAGS